MPTIDADTLRQFAAELLMAGGFSAPDAEETAELLVWANLRGVDSHGVLRIPLYVDWIAQGVMASGQTPQEVHRFGAITVLDGARCPGAVGMNRAVACAVASARDLGLGWCAARRISHAGAIGFFTSKVAEQGLVGIAMTASKPLMSYAGAKGSALSTNPLSIAVPRGDDTAPIVLDMSTASVALGKVMAARDAGRPIPEGWGVDGDGQPTTDPNAVETLLPMAGPKGSGLSLMIELLTSVLAGNAVIGPVLSGGTQDGFNGLVLAVDPVAFGEQDAFAREVANLADAIHRLDPAPGYDAVRLPGERGAETHVTRMAEGIPIPPGTAARLTKLADRLGVARPAAL